MNVKSLVALSLLLICLGAQSQQVQSNSPERDGYLVTQILDSISINIGKPIYVDPRFNASQRAHIFGKGLNEHNYGDLLRILRLQGFTAYETGDAINVVLTQGIRSNAVPIFEEGEHYYPDQYINKIITLANLCAVSVLPKIRPLVAPSSHLTADMDANALIMVDTYDNILRIESILKQLEQSTDTRQNCHNNAVR